MNTAEQKPGFAWPSMVHGRRWTAESVVRAIQDFAAVTGKPPTIRDWRESGWWPDPSTVCRKLGSWSEALQAAGFESGRGLYQRGGPRGSYSQEAAPASRTTPASIVLRDGRE